MESLEFIDEVEAKQIQLPFCPRAVFLYYYQKSHTAPSGAGLSKRRYLGLKDLFFSRLVSVPLSVPFPCPLPAGW